MTENFPALIVTVPLLSAMLLPVLALVSVRLMRAYGSLVLAAVLSMSIHTLAAAVAHGPIHYVFGGWLAPWGIEYVADPLSGLMCVLISAYSLLVFFGIGRESETWADLQAGTFHALYMLLTAGLLGMSITGDLFNIYVFLEISALSGYALISAGGHRAKVAAFRYLIIGSVGASFYVIGLGYLYSLTGTLNIADMVPRLQALGFAPPVAAGLAFILAGAAIKMALFPLHGWQPDAYTYSPSSVIPFVSAVMAKVAAYLMIRVLFTVFAGQGPALRMLDILAWAGALSMIAGSLFAMAQSDVRRMLAYSSVAQIGYIALGIGIGNALALTGAIVHIVNHAVMKGCLFMTVAGFRSRTGGKAEIKDLAGMGYRMPWTSAAFTVAALSMIGLPPACGFFSKLYLLTGAVEAHLWQFAAVLAASTLLNTVYFFKVIEQLYLRDSEGHKTRREAPLPYLLPSVALGTAVLLLGVFNQSWINGVVGPAVEVLLR